MNDERLAIDLLGMRFSEAFRDWRLATELPLTPGQRDSLWHLVICYRGQMPDVLVQRAERWLSVQPKRRAFEDSLDENPYNWRRRLSFADWLELTESFDDARAQRWMVTNECAPALTSREGKHREFDWYFNPQMDARISANWSRAWFPSRELAELFCSQRLRAIDVSEPPAQ